MHGHQFADRLTCLAVEADLGASIEDPEVDFFVDLIDFLPRFLHESIATIRVKLETAYDLP